mmetsp:Transcript_346/g.722  ORF Transcript_346/g.722 Transcript_346/m.722 type:complete len:392 (-) Transcript_346:90-1265(-)
MSEVKILRVQVHSPLSILTQVCDHRRIAKVVHVVGAALMVKQNVPVSPARGARVEITHDIVTVALALAPSTVRDPGGLSLIVRQHGQLEARLRRQQERVRVRFGHVGHVIEAAPRVPMEGDPVHVLRRRAVSAEQSVRPLLDVVLVVVVPKDLDVGVGLLESRTEMFGDEIAGLLRSVDARLPRLLRLRFVLHGHAPHGHALSLVGRDPLGEILGPRLLGLVQQRPSPQHVVVVLHPGWGRPRRAEQFERWVGRNGRVDHGQRKILVVRHSRVELLQIVVARYVVEGVGVDRKVARVDWHAACCVADPCRAVVGLDHRGLELFGQLLVHCRTRLGQRSAEPMDLLEGLGGVNRNLDRIVGGLRREGKRGLLCQPVGCGRGGLEPADGFAGG